MTERSTQEISGSSRQIINLNYLDREAHIFKTSKQTLVESSKQLEDVIEENTKQEVADIEAAIYRLATA